ncbi:uncharacterized protein LOC144428234 [Styela clava]
MGIQGVLETKYLRPSEIRFVHDTIAYYFRNGNVLNDVAEKVRKLILNPSDFPTINVFKRDGKYYSLNNRRLYVFRVGEYSGVIGEIEVNIVGENELKEWMFTTQNDGRKVTLRGGEQTLPHCREHWLSTSRSYRLSNEEFILPTKDNKIPTSQPKHCTPVSIPLHQSVNIKMPELDEKNWNTNDWCNCTLRTFVRMGRQERHRVFETKYLRPSEIRFIHDTIAYNFRDRNVVNFVAEMVRKRMLRPSAFPTINVFKRDGKYYSLNNRRLYVFRVGEYNGVIGEIEVNIVGENELKEWKFTTQNDGREVTLRGGQQTLPHCREHWLSTSQSHRPSDEFFFMPTRDIRVPKSQPKHFTPVSIPSHQPVKITMPRLDEENWDTNGWCKCTIL